MSIKRQHDVVELQITVDDTILMEILKSQANFGGIKPRNQTMSVHLLAEEEKKSALG